MQLNKDENTQQFSIRSYTPGEVLINEQTYAENLLLTPGELFKDKLPKTPEELNETLLEDLLEFNPSVVILGTGEKHKQLEPRLSAFLLQNGVGIEVMHSKAACKTYNVLMSENRNALLLLFI